MKDLIRRIIKEEVSNRRQEKLMYMVKNYGINQTSKVVGGLDNLLKILDINSPMDFLHLFDDLDVVQSEEKPKLILFRYKPKHNLMIYDRKYEYVYISYHEIWGVLESNFGLNIRQIQELTEEWLGEAYNLGGDLSVDWMLS